MKSPEEKSKDVRLEDLTGKTFNFLTALKYAGRGRRTNRAGGSVWIFSCVCGKEILSLAKHVKAGRTKSCGCRKSGLVRDSKVLPNFQEIWNRSYHNHRTCAKRRGLKTYLSKKQWTEIARKPCSYCGEFSVRKTQRAVKARISLDDALRTGEAAQVNSVDRLNNEPFYRVSNSVPACFKCQRIKGQLSFEAFRVHILKIAIHSKLIAG